MPRKKPSKDTQSSPLHQPTLAGFINSKSASMASPTAKPQPTAKTTLKSSKSTASGASTSKHAPADSSKIGPPASKRRSAAKRKRTKSPKKRRREITREKSPSEESDGDSDTGALRAIRFESQEEDTHTGGSTMEVTSSSEDEDQIVSPSRPKRTATQAKRRVRASSGSSADSDIEVIGGSAGAPRKGKRRLKRRLMSSDEENATETEEEGIPSPKKRRLVKGLKPSTSEEEINLMDEVDEHRECGPPRRDCRRFSRNYTDIVVDIVDSRLRARDKKSAFQRSLETLKRTLPHARRYSMISVMMQARGAVYPWTLLAHPRRRKRKRKTSPS